MPSFFVVDVLNGCVILHSENRSEVVLQGGQEFVSAFQSGVDRLDKDIIRGA